MKKLSTVFLVLSLILNVILGVMVFNNEFDYGSIEITDTPEAISQFSAAAVYGPEGMETIEGDATISSHGVWLQNMLITGNLYLTEEIADGSAALKNVTVMGKTFVEGGGENSIYLEDSTIDEIIVNRKDAKVMVVAKGKTTINTVRVENDALLEEIDIAEGFEGFVDLYIEENVSAEVSGFFKNISLTGENSSLLITAGKAGNLLLAKEAKEASIQLAEEVIIEKAIFDAAVGMSTKATVEELTINSSGLTTLSGNFKNIICTQTASFITLAGGTYENIKVQEDISSISIQVEEEVVVEKLELNSRTAVTGKGLIKYAVINHAGCSFEKAPEKFDVKSGIKFTAGGEELPKVVEKKELAPQPTPTQPSPSPAPAPAPESPKVGNLSKLENQPLFGSTSIKITLSGTKSPQNYTVSMPSYGATFLYESGYFIWAAPSNNDIFQNSVSTLTSAVKITPK